MGVGNAGLRLRSQATRVATDKIVAGQIVRAQRGGMPAKDPEKRRATVRAWYARAKHRFGPEEFERRRRNRTARQQSLIAWFAELKKTLACERCGEDHPGCLVFHHSDPSQKEISLSEAVRRGWSRKRILAERAKCEVLCANCHAKHHAKERHA